jgi:Raf kinase inhibitor-like YbhB/YbcL family protein
MAIQIQSTAFAPNGTIPKQHTGEGRDVSPPLSWSGLPAGTKELALVCDDPDAPGREPWVHWVLYKLRADQKGLAAGESAGVAGTNSWPTAGWRGPMPPPGHGVHHYHFRLYALDAELDAGPGLSKAKLLKAMEGHVLAQGELVGTYERRR